MALARPRPCERGRIVNGAQLDLFTSRVPHRPYCTDELGTLRIRDKATALAKRYIQVNPPATVGYLVFDVDREGAAFSWEQRNLPAPSWAAVNPANGHAHLAYAIETPIVRTDAARQKPLKFLAAIQGAFTAQLGADPGYAMFITKNPLNPSWRVISHDRAVYGLHQLAEYVDLKAKVPKREVSGLGRNCDLFDALRRRAYREVTAFREGSDYERWMRFILDTAHKLNSYTQPLPDSEIRATAKSIGKWTWRHFGHGAAVERFIDRQKARQRRAAMARKGSVSARIVDAIAGLQRAGKRVTVSAVARLAGVTRPTVYKRQSLLTAVLVTSLESPAAAPSLPGVKLAKSDNSGLGVSCGQGGQKPGL